MKEEKLFTGLVQEGRCPVPMTTVQQGGTLDRGRSPVPITPHNQNTPSAPVQNNQQAGTPGKKV